MKIPQDVINIANAYHSSNKDLFIVGGAVRDFLLGKNPHDFDLVTNASPEESKIILKDFNVSDEQGKNFGVLRIYTESEPQGYEIAVYRKDISKGRDVKGDEQKVEIGNHVTIEDDVKRRDLSMNSLFYDINKKEVIDLVGGIEDLNNKIIRAVGDPSERFQEDRLRILRCFRACSRINGTIDLLTANAIKNDNRLRNINSKEDVSQERIIEEFYKVFEHSINDKYILRRYINLLSIFNMWSEMFPNIDINPHIDIDIVSKPIVFFNLFKGNIKSNIKILNNLKFPTSLINEMIFLEEFNKISVYKLAKLKERFHIDNNLILNFSNDLNFSNKFIKYCEDGFVIDGLDLIDKGFKGAEIEKEKERLELLRFEEY